MQKIFCSGKPAICGFGYVEVVEYPPHAGKYGAGGWSRKAKERPKPVVRFGRTRYLMLEGKKMVILEHYVREDAVGLHNGGYVKPGDEVIVSTAEGNVAVVMIDGSDRRRKLNLFDLDDKVWLRLDYPEFKSEEGRARYVNE